MIFQSFILDNLVSLCMKIINSVVVVGLYYGFLTTFSIGPSYLFLLRARVMEEGTQKKVSATTGFITGQLMMFISIYYAPLHLALGRPHTITVLALPYLVFNFFLYNKKYRIGSTANKTNSIRNLSIQCLFLNNLIFQLFNHFFLPSSMLVRLVNIYMFRSNNKILFVISSFFGWLMGHIFFMKWMELVLVWIQQNNFIKSNVLIKYKLIISNKYIVSELKILMYRILSILLFITCVFYLGRMPSPIFTKKFPEISETEEDWESKKKIDVEIEKNSENKRTKEKQEGYTKKYLFFSGEKIDEPEEIRTNVKEKRKDEFYFKETDYKDIAVSETSYRDLDQENSKFAIFKDNDNKNNKELFRFEKPLVTILFNYKRWNRPLRYIKNDQFENAVRNEMSQYFFYTCQSDGKERMVFTYPPSLSTFLEMIERRISLLTTEKLSYSYDELYNHWSFTNDQKRNKLRNKFLNGADALDKGFIPLDVLEKRIRLCNDETKKKYLPKIYDPFLNGPYRGQIKKKNTLSIINETSIRNFIWINKIHAILLTTNYPKFEHQKYTFDKKSLSTKISYFLNLIRKFSGKSISSLNFQKLFLFPEPEEVRIDSEDKRIFFNFFFDVVISDPNDKKIVNKKKFIGIKEIRKKVPRWPEKLINDLEQAEEEDEEGLTEEHQIRSRKSKRVVIFSDDKPQNDDTYTNTKDTKDTKNRDQVNELALIRYSHQSDFRRDIIKGSMRAQRRKTAIWKLFQTSAHSPLFLDRIEKPSFLSFDILDPIKIIFILKNCMRKNKKTELKISDSTEKKAKETKEEKEAKETKEENKRREKTRLAIAEAWDSIIFAQVIRGLLLITHSIVRKYIILPSLIIAKNIVRMLLFQSSEWSEDLKDWNREVHIKCTYNGVQLSEKEFPKNWLTDGIQIKILFPFRLKPWHRSKLRSLQKDTLKKKAQKNDFCFLTVLGMESELPFDSPRKGFSFFEPIFKKLKNIYIKLKKKNFLVRKVLNEKTKFFINVSKETKEWVIKTFKTFRNFIKEIRKELSKINPILLFGLKEIYDVSETKKGKDSIISKSNPIIYESSRSMNWTNFSLTEKKIKDLTDRTKTILNQIEKITKDKKKEFITPEKNISSNKTSYDKRLELKKDIWRILKRRNVRSIRKSHHFLKFFIERVYIDICLYIINIPRIHIKLFLKSTKKIINNYIHTNKANQERIDKTNQSIIHFISNIKRSTSNSSHTNSQTNSQIFCDVSYLSQAYVFYKLSQTQVINLYKLRSVFQYHGASLFLKNEIKDYFVEVHGIVHSELNHNNSVMNQWKNWLRSHYQYDLSKIGWSRLVRQKWRNRINQRCMSPNRDLSKCDLYEKSQLIHYEKKKYFEVDSLPNQKNKLKKQYRYDLLAYKFINYADKMDSHIYRYRSGLQANNNRVISYNYNTHKRTLLDMLGGIPINNYLVENNIPDMEKNPDRKYFDWRILNFCLRNKVDIDAWIDTGINSNKNTKTGANNSQIIDKTNNKGFFYYLRVDQDQEINPSNQKKHFSDWMGMNVEILSRPISNLELWFFSKFEIFFNEYRSKPWVIPIKLLLLNCNVNKNVSENKNITGKKKKKRDIFLSPNAKKSLEFELETRNQTETEYAGLADLELTLSKHENPVDEDSVESKMKISKKKKKYKNNIETELSFFQRRFLGFQLKWDKAIGQRLTNNIKVYCLLLRLRKPKEITISFIQRGELNLDIMKIRKDFTLTELIKNSILIIEPLRLSIKNNGQFILYQTISISLIHKSKHQINQRYREKRYVDQKNFDESVARQQKMTENKEKNYYDLLVPENILSSRRRRKLRILICFNSSNRKYMPRNTEFCNGNGVKNCCQVLAKNKDLDRDKNKLIKLKLFLWPNSRLEDLACMNRYWFDTNNGSRFSMVRIHMYPRLKIS
uniref:Ycf1 n=1 Tax=Suriana maritima TaxID=32256 RepID=A0A6H0DYN7_SURMA|nr:Ycf1 [Suriana maritima]QIS95157.1 Ycf1 [Suriana maritima]QIV68311.1 hypothetical protein RF1 [Suriana maritima]